MVIDILTRRRVLKMGAGLAVGGIAVAKLPSWVVGYVMSPGVARTLATEPPRYSPRNSDVVTLERAADPPEDGTGRDHAVHVTSAETTTHYAFSLVRMGQQGLRVRDIEELRYDFYVPDGTENTVGERESIAPDEVWLILQTRGGGREQVFRTWHDQQTEAECITRNIREEFSGLERSPWKRLDEDDRDFAVVDDLVDAYGDARVVGAGFGRGDPIMGPSDLNIFYDNLVVNGESFTFPV